MISKKRCLENSRLYAITDLQAENPLTLKKIRSALTGGVDIIQLRSKTFSDVRMLALGTSIRKVTRKLGKLFIVNDRVDVALALEADGVHLGQYDLPIQFARRLANRRDFLIGKSTHNARQAREAEREGADYIGFGPIFTTPTKPTYAAAGLEAIEAVMKKIKIPVVCIGGIDRENLREVLHAGAKRVAVVRAIFAQDDCSKAARGLKALLLEQNN